MPSEILRIRSYTGNKISIEPGKIWAKSELEYPRIIIPIVLDLNPIVESNISQMNFVIISIQGELFISGKNHSKISDSMSGSYSYNVRFPNVQTTYNLEFLLDNKRITKIEEERRNNLIMQLDLRLIIGLYEQNFINSIEPVYGQISFEIEQSHWVNKILPSLSYGEYFIIEIPKGNEQINEAWKYINKAENCFNTWDTKGTFANCRELGTFLNNLIKEKLDLDPNIKKWNRSFERFSHQVSLFLHVEEEDIKNKEPKGSININKNDAEHILIVTKALLKYAEGLLRENSI